MGTRCGGCRCHHLRARWGKGSRRSCGRGACESVRGRPNIRVSRTDAKAAPASRPARKDRQRLARPAESCLLRPRTDPRPSITDGPSHTVTGSSCSGGGTAVAEPPRLIARARLGLVRVDRSVGPAPPVLAHRCSSRRAPFVAGAVAGGARRPTGGVRPPTRKPRGCGAFVMRRRGLEPPRAIQPTRPSTLRVYQFRHRRRWPRRGRGTASIALGCIRPPPALRSEQVFVPRPAPSPRSPLRWT